MQEFSAVYIETEFRLLWINDWKTGNRISNRPGVIDGHGKNLYNTIIKREDKAFASWKM